MIPAFTGSGVIPPYVGADGPGCSPAQMSPYPVTTLDVVRSLGGTKSRLDIIGDWLEHREKLRRLGLIKAFQWIDGSFTENKDPKDIDIVTFFYPPAGVSTVDEKNEFLRKNPSVLSRGGVKSAYKIDSFLVDLGSASESIVGLTRYWFGLFSHRRDDELWKGMLEVKLQDASESDARALLNERIAVSI
jgi:hypothetical protein